MLDDKNFLSWTQDDTIVENLKSEIERLKNEKTAVEKENAGLKEQVKQLQDENLRLKRESQLSRPPLKELRKVNRAH